jgi:ATP-binding cassette subfamily B protein AbcA/BmrA
VPSLFRQLSQLVGRAQLAGSGAAVVLTLLEVGGQLWFPILTRDLVDELSSGGAHGRTLVLLGAVLVGMAAVGAAARYLLARIGHQVAAGLQRRLTAHLLEQPMRFYDQRSTGELVSRVTSDCTRIADLIAEHMMTALSGSLLLIGSVVVLCVLDARLTLVLFGLVAAAFVVSLPVVRRTEAIARAQQDRIAGISALLTQLFSEIRMVKAHVAEEHEIGRTSSAIEEVVRTGIRAARLKVVLEPIVGLAITAPLLTILATAACGSCGAT